MGSVVSSMRAAEIDAIRGQLGDAVRHDRAREVDRLAAGATKWDVGDESHVGASYPR